MFFLKTFGCTRKVYNLYVYYLYEHFGEKTRTKSEKKHEPNRIKNMKEIKMYADKNGVFHEYNDEWDVTINCETQEDHILWT